MVASGRTVDPHCRLITPSTIRMLGKNGMSSTPTEKVSSHTFVSTITYIFLLVVVAVAIGERSFAAVMLSGIFSLLSASLFVLMDAVDVAFTEAAVGAGISTVLMLMVLHLTADKETHNGDVKVFPLLISVLCGAVLLYATQDMPHFGDPNAYIHQSATADHYLNQSYDDSHIPNIVTTILASYRGFDTLGETTVVLTAAVAVMMLLGRPKEEEQDWDQNPMPSLKWAQKC